MGISSGIARICDNLVAAVDPISAAKRAGARKALEVINTGYSEGGAATGTNWARGWKYRGGSVVEDQEKNLTILRQRSRNLYMTAPIARAALNRKTVNVIGPGLRMRSTPDAEVLSLTPDDAIAYARAREREFMLWANSHDCEVSGLDNFQDIQSLAYLMWGMNGDCICLLLNADPIDQPYELRLQLIESDRVCNPPGKETTPLFHDGVEVDSSGRVVAYHIRNTHPHSNGNMEQPKWARVPVRGKTGRLNVLHLISRERADQYRGIPVLAPVIESCKQLSRYSEAELMAAVISAFITVLVKSKTPEFTLENAFAGTADDVTAGDANTVSDSNYNLPLGEATMIALNPDESAEVVNPNRPNSQFEAFVESVTKEIGAATDIPVELLTLKFTSTYTAARAALLEFWKRARIDRATFAANFNNPIAQEIFEEGILKGRIQAPGYFDDYAVKAAWLACQWNGQAMGQMNPKDEIAAAKARIDAGLSTHSKESMEVSGLEFDDICQETTVEWHRLRETGNPAYAEQTQDPTDDNNPQLGSE